MIIGQARHGKDHAAEYLHKYFGMSYKGSSLLCAEIFIFDELKQKYGYENIDECFNDRHNHRKEWYELISEFNTPDLTSLASNIFDTQDCYVGIRRYNELKACQEKWPELLTVYIDRSKVLPEESSQSCTISKQQADIVIENNSTIKDFEDKLYRLGFYLL
jgi:hypothetical protein